MRPVPLPGLRRLRRERQIAQDRQVLGVTVLRGRGEVGAAGEDDLAVDDDDLVVGNGEGSVAIFRSQAP